MSAELQRAIVRQFKSDTGIHAVASDWIYYGEAGRDAMPYVTFLFVGSSRQKTFRDSDCWDDVMVQFSVFDAGKGISDVQAIHEALVDCFDRASLTFEGGKKGIGCQLESWTGPTRLEDCWQMTETFVMGMS